jgi:tetratricopeptide (TPR) repeat protein
MLAGIGFARIDRSYDLLQDSTVWSFFKIVRAALYVIAEIPEASPISDTTSVWRSGNLTGVPYDAGILRWATFSLRLVYELFLVVAVLRVLDFSRRRILLSDIGELSAKLRSVNRTERNTAIGALGRLGLAGREEAIALLISVATARIGERGPFQHALDQRDMAAGLLSEIGDKRGRSDALLAAVAAYRGALEERTQKHVPLEWAATQRDLGVALTTLGGRESGTERLQEAVAVFCESLKEFTPEGTPLPWAETMVQLGGALWCLGERESRPERLEQAVVAFGAALTRYTQEKTSRQWAIAQNNLGNVLSSLGERESGTEKLEKAVVAFGDALKVLTCDRTRPEYAATQCNLGNEPPPN